MKRKKAVRADENTAEYREMAHAAYVLASETLLKFYESLPDPAAPDEQQRDERRRAARVKESMKSWPK